METSNPPPDDSDRPISPVPGYSQEDPLGLNTLSVPNCAFDIGPDDLIDVDAREKINAIKRKKQLASNHTLNWVGAQGGLFLKNFRGVPYF